MSGAAGVTARPEGVSDYGEQSIYGTQPDGTMPGNIY